MSRKLYDIAVARSGDKGSAANIGLIARQPNDYETIKRLVTTEKVEAFFKQMGVGTVIRYELPNLGALNFILPDILQGGGSLNLRIDAQGKALGQALLEMEIDG
jgi:hypothetical protein